MQLTSTRRRLQDGQAYIRISDHWQTLHPPPSPDELHPFPVPIPPPHRCAMPILHDEPEGSIPSSTKATRGRRRGKKQKKNTGGRLCFRCQADDHLSFNCPRRQKYCWRCGSQEHWPNDCLWPAPQVSSWCSKCFSQGAHKEIDCPKYEQCKKCEVYGPFNFLKRHQCRSTTCSPSFDNQNSDIYDLIDPEAS